MALNKLPGPHCTSKFLLAACEYRSYRCLKTLLNAKVLPTRKILKQLASESQYEARCFKIMKEFDVQLCYEQLAMASLSTTWPNQLEKFTFFIKEGKVDLKNVPLVHRAVESSSLEVLKYLVEENADVNFFSARRENGLNIFEAPLHAAIHIQSKKIAKYLLKSGADPNLEDSRGLSPLNICVQAKKSEAARELAGLLLDYGADVNGKGGVNRSPIESALKYDRLDLLHRFSKQDGNPNVKYLAIAWLRQIQNRPDKTKSWQLFYCTVKTAQNRKRGIT